MGKSCSMTISYFIENNVGVMSNNPTPIDKIKTKIEMLGYQHGSSVHAANLFGFSDCETKILLWPNKISP